MSENLSRLYRQCREPFIIDSVYTSSHRHKGTEDNQTTE
jgi:hypothetical protein